MDPGIRVRGRDRRLQPAPGPRLDRARDLLRLAASRPLGGARRRRRVHPPRPRHDPRAGRALPRRLAAALGSRCGRRRRGGRRGGRAVAARARPLARQPARGPAAPSLARLPARWRRAPPRRSGRGSCSFCSAAAPRARPSWPCAAHSAHWSSRSRCSAAPPPGAAALVWVAFKVGALSFGGGFVIIPLMQADAVSHYHWMTTAQFLNAVALGQVTPGPVVPDGRRGRLRGRRRRAAGCSPRSVAFAPSFVFVLLGGAPLRAARARHARAGLSRRRGPGAVGAILGSAIPLAARALGARGSTPSSPPRRVRAARAAARVVDVLLAAGAGVVVALAGGSLPA